MARVASNALLAPLGIRGPPREPTRELWLSLRRDLQEERRGRANDDDGAPPEGPEEVEHYRSRRCNSLGTPMAYDEPRALLVGNTIFRETLADRFWARPLLSLEVFNGRVYLMAWWRPDETLESGRPLPATRPENWHTTLAVGYFPPGRAPVLTQEEIRQVREPCRAIFWAVLGNRVTWRERDGAMLVSFSRSPWGRNSWVFGIGGVQWTALLVTQSNARVLFRQANFQLRENGPEERLHISWNN